MLISKLTSVSARPFLLLASVTCMLIVTAMPAAAEEAAATLEALLDRAKIENLIADYYSNLGSGSHKFGDFYLEDSILDVDGTVAQGKKPIEDLYKKAAAEGPPRKGTFRMLLTNLNIVVNGATATADVIWTGINSETVRSTPQLVEQGREHDELVKRNGRWFFKHRVISSDGGLSGYFEKNYKPR